MLAALLLLTACTQAGTPGPAPEASTSDAAAETDETLRDAALELVAVRDEALVDGDRDAFLATVDPDAL